MTKIIHGRVDTKAYKETMKKHGLLMPSITPRVAITPIFPTASNRYIADLKQIAEMSALGRLGIIGKDLHGMGIKPLKLLYDILRRDMCAVGKEIVQRKSRGKKQS